MKLLRPILLVLSLLSALLPFWVEAKSEPSAEHGKNHSAPAYIDAKRFDSLRFLSPPPTGMEAEEEMRIVLQWQSIRTEAMAQKAIADADQSIFNFSDVLGPLFNRQQLPLINYFFNGIYKTESALNRQGKNHWNRLRPPFQNATVKPVGEYTNEGSYPSGHSTFSWLAGILLSDMVPEKKSELMLRARLMGLNRVIGGFHFPSDVEAGKILAVVCLQEMKSNAQFQADFHAARQELRQALHLAP
jgi:acid phosphatase (class A)